MGGQPAVPTETQSIQAYNPNALDWANYALKQQMQGLQMQYYTPLLKDTMEKRKLYKGVVNNDPEALRQFAGMPKGATPQQVLDRINTYRGRGTPNPTMPNPQMPSEMRKAAAGGIKQLKGNKNGNEPKKTAEPKAEKAKPGLTQDQATFVQQMGKLMESGKTPTQAQQDRLNKIEGFTGRDVSPYSTAGTIAPTNKGVASAATRMSTAFNKSQQPAGVVEEPTPNVVSEMGQYGRQYGVIGDPNNPATPIQITDPWANKAFDYLNQMQAPSEWGQAGGMLGTAAQGLQGLANYTPQQVAYQNATAERASAQQASAERATAAQMAAIKDVQAQKLQRYQMEGKVPEVTTKDLEAYQMAGPGSWTEEGVQQKYMSPYMQGVIDISKREAERDYLKQANALNAKAISAGAFGGSRQALERSEAQRNYNQQLQDLQVKGLQQAYESGRSQYGQELSLSQQAALQNLQSKLSTQSQSSQQQLQAMLSNQNIDYQTKVQNLQAMLGVQSQEAQQMLQAALANQQTQFGVGSLNANLANQTALQNAQLGTQASMTNAQLGTQASLANAQNALQASMANQQTQFGVGSLNANLAQQAALANQQAGIAGAGLNLNAYNAQQNAAQGLGSLGNSNANWTQQQFGNAKQLADWSMQQGQGYLDRNTQGNLNIYNASNMPAGAPT